MSAPEFIIQFRDCTDFESGLWLLPKLHDPFKDYALAGAKGLDALAERLHSAQDPQEVAHALANDWGFSGDKQHYHRPENCFLTIVSNTGLACPLRWSVCGYSFANGLATRYGRSPFPDTSLAAGMVAMSTAFTAGKDQ